MILAHYTINDKVVRQGTILSLQPGGEWMVSSIQTVTDQNFLRKHRGYNICITLRNKVVTRTGSTIRYLYIHHINPSRRCLFEMGNKYMLECNITGIHAR